MRDFYDTILGPWHERKKRLKEILDEKRLLDICNVIAALGVRERISDEQFEIIYHHPNLKMLKLALENIMELEKIEDVALNNILENGYRKQLPWNNKHLSNQSSFYNVPNSIFQCLRDTQTFTAKNLRNVFSMNICEFYMALCILNESNELSKNNIDLIITNTPEKNPTLCIEIAKTILVINCLLFENESLFMSQNEKQEILNADSPSSAFIFWRRSQPERINEMESSWLQEQNMPLLVHG